MCKWHDFCSTFSFALTLYVQVLNAIMLTWGQIKGNRRYVWYMKVSSITREGYLIVTADSSMNSIIGWKMQPLEFLGLTLWLI